MQSSSLLKESWGIKQHDVKHVTIVMSWHCLGCHNHCATGSHSRVPECPPRDTQCSANQQGQGFTPDRVSLCHRRASASKLCRSSVRQACGNSMVAYTGLSFPAKLQQAVLPFSLCILPRAVSQQKTSESRGWKGSSRVSILHEMLYSTELQGSVPFFAYAPPTG